ncbi:MAG: polymer-forming cytoskeletal protein [Alphaproteobacteria bacterium]
MLWKRKSDDEDGNQANPESAQVEPSLKLKSAAPTVSAPAPTGTAKPAAPSSVEPPRRPLTPPDIAAGRRDSRPAPPTSSGNDGKRLIVGRDIVLNGEITSCEKLVIEGRVQANVTDCREIVIAPSGAFKGSAEIESAEISGNFHGTLSVRERLLIRATGRVEGEIRYGKLEIECGGEITGQIQSIGGQLKFGGGESSS